MEQFDGLLKQYNMPPIHFGDSFDKLQEQLDILDRIIHDLAVRRKAIIIKINSFKDVNDERRAKELANELRSITIPPVDQFQPSHRVYMLIEERNRLQSQVQKLMKDSQVAELISRLTDALQIKDLGAAESVIKQLDTLVLDDQTLEKAKGLRKTYIQLVKEQLI